MSSTVTLTLELVDFPLPAECLLTSQPDLITGFEKIDLYMIIYVISICVLVVGF